MFSEVTILLALTVFHTMFTGSLPQVSDSTPLLGQLQLLVLSSSSLLWSLSLSSSCPSRFRTPPLS